MIEFSLVPSLICFVVGFLAGVVTLMLFNKMRSGSASPETVKQQLDQYQQEVEQHFEQTSQKFKSMTEQYQDLYNHLSVGATTLCRPDSNITGLENKSEIVQQKIESDQATVDSEIKSEPAETKPTDIKDELAEKESEPKASESVSEDQPSDLTKKTQDQTENKQKPESTEKPKKD